MSDDDDNLDEINDNVIQLESESDIKSNETFNDDDYYNNNIEDYKNAEYLPSIEPPKEAAFTSRRQNDNRPIHSVNETFMNFNEKFQKINNEEYEDEFSLPSAEEICENYKTTFNINIDYSSNNYDTFSKNHLRNTLIEQIKKIDWINQRAKINEAKKETNAYEDIKEIAFDRKQSYQLANINFLFEKNLIKNDNLYGGIPVLLVGDNGGLTDFILYYTIQKGGYNPTIFVIPEKKNDIKNAKYRRDIKDKANDNVKILEEFYQDNKDLDENTDISNEFINKIVDTIDKETNSYNVNLYIARKVVRFAPDSSQEIKYKKFLLINILLAFKTLNQGGNFIIKLYDMFTQFTIGLIYMIFKNFENVSIFKPVSTRQYSPSRYLVAENYLKKEDESIKYLENFLAKYLEFTKNKYDVKLFLPSAELRKSEKFLKIIPEINNEITEKRIDALKEIQNYIDKKTTKLYDKMEIKKFFLDNWGLPIVNYDESKLLKNQHKKDYHESNKKYYTEEELAEAYKDIGKFDEDQLKMLNWMKIGNKKHKKKVNYIDEEFKHEKVLNPEEELQAKYDRIAEKLGKKKSNVHRKTKKENNEQKNESTKKSKKSKKDEDNEDKKLLNKKTERSEKISEKKQKKKSKKNDDYDDDLDLRKEFSEGTKELTKKLEKLEKYKVSKK